MSSSLTFDGCRSRDEAKDRLRAWLRDLASDHERKLVSTGLHQDAIDIDHLDTLIDADRSTFEHGADEVLKRLDTLDSATREP